MKILTVIGTRPQFIKASPVSHALMASGTVEVIVNTGQHYDINMSELFFKELKIPEAMWGLLKIGVGGYVVGRSGEKMVESYAKNRN